MNNRLHTVAALTAIGLSMTLCHGARACGSAAAMAGPSALLPAGSSGLLAKSAAGVGLEQAIPGMTNPLQQLEPITGLYRFVFTAKGDPGVPDGAVLDQGFVTWHADGTELMNSGRAPMTQSFCMGAWTRTGPQTYRLNHWALSWDPAGKTFVGPANIREYVRLDLAGNSYSGSFTLVQYATDGKTQLAQLQGSVTGTRVIP